MSTSRRKLMRKLGAIDKDGNPIDAADIKAGEKKAVPMRFAGTTLLVHIGEGQRINPKREYMRQMGINPKRLKKMRAKEKKLKREALKTNQ